jgi:N12 class adenine-specific DNA methylase
MNTVNKKLIDSIFELASKTDMTFATCVNSCLYGRKRQAQDVSIISGVLLTFEWGNFVTRFTQIITTLMKRKAELDTTYKNVYKDVFGSVKEGMYQDLNLECVCEVLDEFEEIYQSLEVLRVLGLQHDFEGMNENLVSAIKNYTYYRDLAHARVIGFNVEFYNFLKNGNTSNHA